MAKVFITGSADGLGRMAAGKLISLGHEVVLHARSKERAKDAQKENPGAVACLTGDLSIISQTKSVAEQVNAIGSFDAVIHNAAIGYRESTRTVTTDGLSQLFAINSLAPFILTALITRPKRLIFLSSGLHRQGNASSDDLNWERKRWSGYQAYSDSKLHDLVLALAIARRWPEVCSNAVEPGWVATKMGGAGAPDDLEKGAETQVWLAVSNEPETMVTGKYFFHKRPRDYNMIAADVIVQDKFIIACESLSGVKLPA
jgi:NAD(P)-dependent dehydrogenase (short-subunit alcohol dehydrogenase family)